MCATTNNEKYLRDKTGNTRFWPIKAGEIDLVALRRDRDQLWGEAAFLESQGVPHWLSEELAEAAAHEAAKREVVNPVEEKITGLLSNAPDGFVPSDELWKALGLQDAARRTQAHLESMGDAARKANWKRKRKRDATGEQQSGYLAPGLKLIDADWLHYSTSGRLVVQKRRSS
jgi:predicted P-loop ATPase